LHMMEKEKEGMERGDRLASSSVSIAKGSVARETSAMGVQEAGAVARGVGPGCIHWRAGGAVTNSRIGCGRRGCGGMGASR